MNNYNIPDYCTHVKLDIGLSYAAPQSQIWLNKEPNLMVFGFEPNPEAVKQILEGKPKSSPNHFDSLEKKYINNCQFHLLPVALSNVEKEETMKFYVNKNDCGTSSLFKHDEIRLGKIKSVIDVSVTNLKIFFDDFPWEKFEYIDYIKIDAQGSDLNILKGAGNYLSDKVVYVTAEADGHFYFNSHAVTSMS